MSLAEILQCPEGKTLEFKRELPLGEYFLKTVVAFANTAGGVVAIGVEDGTRRVVGVPDPLVIESRIASMISDNVRPLLIPEIEIFPWRRTHVVAVRIHPSSGRPHYLKALGAEQGAFVRVGSTNRRADQATLTELRRLTETRTFDEQAMAELSSEALDFRAASELFAPVRQLRERDLLVLGLTTRYQGKIRPTVGGVLLFGTARERWFPDAWLQAGRFEGADRSKISDTTEFHSHLPRMIEDALGFVRKHESRSLTIEGPRHTEHWSVPLGAVREALVNAVVHADYAQRGAPIRLSIFDDRIEIENPGLLPFGLTVPDIRRGISKLRNRVVGRVFKELGLIEQWGSGIGRMTGLCLDAGLPEPEFEEIGFHFRATIVKRRTGFPRLDAVEQRVLEFLADGPGRTTSEISKAIGRSARATRTRLAALVSRGIIVEIGSGPRDPRRTYHLSKQP